MDIGSIDREKLATYIAERVHEQLSHITAYWPSPTSGPRYSPQGVHAAVWNTVMHDDEMLAAIIAIQGQAPGIFAKTYETAGVEVSPATIAAILEHMADQVYEVNLANGWFEEDRRVGEDIALLHTEASEMLEAYRDHGLKDATVTDPLEIELGASPKPEGFGSEAADVLIRLLDTCTRRGVDLGFEFQRKLAYNKTRGYRHGGKNL